MNEESSIIEKLRELAQDWATADFMTEEQPENEVLAYCAERIFEIVGLR